MVSLDILTESLVVRVRLIVYGVLILFSFFIFVGVAVMKDKLGLCPLYADIENGKFVQVPPASNCNYPMAIAIIFQLIYLLFRMVILILLALGKFTTEMFVFSNILELIYVMIDLAIFILTFIGACILSAGRNNSDIDFSYFEISSPSNVAQAGAWISTFLWLFIAIVGALYILRAGKLPFRRSSGAATTGNTGPTNASSQPVDTPPNYDPSKY